MLSDSQENTLKQQPFLAGGTLSCQAAERARRLQAAGCEGQTLSGLLDTWSDLPPRHTHCVGVGETAIQNRLRAHPGKAHAGV
jgi:hypothetical protein